jgi:hypothetical protein
MGQMRRMIRRVGLSAGRVSAVGDHGRRFCFLFTDLANPTSDKICRAIGYEPVSESERWDFV